MNFLTVKMKKKDNLDVYLKPWDTHQHLYLNLNDFAVIIKFDWSLTLIAFKLNDS